jgi:hypothetical protein
MGSRFESYAIRLVNLNVCSLPNRSGERTFSPSSLKALLPRSAKRTHICLKLKRVWFRQISLQPTDGFMRKNAVYGLNGQRAYFVMALSQVTYQHPV